jgi:hypothetical protein
MPTVGSTRGGLGVGLSRPINATRTAGIGASWTTLAGISRVSFCGSNDPLGSAEQLKTIRWAGPSGACGCSRPSTGIQPLRSHGSKGRARPPLFRPPNRQRGCPLRVRRVSAIDPVGAWRSDGPEDTAGEARDDRLPQRLATKDGSHTDCVEFLPGVLRAVKPDNRKPSPTG